MRDDELSEDRILVHATNISVFFTMNYPLSQLGIDGERTPPPKEVAPPSNIPSNMYSISPVYYSRPHGSYPQQLSQPPYSDRSQYPYRPTHGVPPQADGPPQQESSPVIEDRTPALKQNERGETTLNFAAIMEIFEKMNKSTSSVRVDAVDNAGQPRESRTYSSGQNQYPPGQREKSEIARHGENASQHGGAAQSRYGRPRPVPYPHHMGSSMGPKMMNRQTGEQTKRQQNEMTENLKTIQKMNASLEIDRRVHSLKQRDLLEENEKKAAEAAQMAQILANQFQQNAAQFGNRPVNNLKNQQQYSTNFNFQSMNPANISARFPQFKNMPQSNMNIGGAQARLKPGYPRWNRTMKQNIFEYYKHLQADQKAKFTTPNSEPGYPRWNRTKKQNIFAYYKHLQAAQKAKFTTPNSEPVITESETNEPEPSNNTHSTVIITEIE